MSDARFDSRSSRRLILASSSTYRARLAAEAGLVMESIAPEVDERQFDPIALNSGARVLAGSLALAKAESVRSQLRSLSGVGPVRSGGEPVGSDPDSDTYPDTGTGGGAGAVIVAADQVGERLTSDGLPTLLAKPDSAAEALAMLLAHSGATVVLTNGLVAMDARSGFWVGCFDTHHIDMGEISRERASEYIERCAPLDCVGAYRIEDGHTFPQWNFVTNIRGDSGLDGIMGLPIEPLRTLLDRLAG